MTIDDRLALVSAAIAARNWPEAFEHGQRLLGELKAMNRQVNPQEINYVDVPDEALRRVVDPHFTALAASLDTAYYQNWRHGLSAPWHGYDVLPDPVATKAQFDRLSGLIWHEYAVALDEADQLQDPEDRIPDKRKIGAEDGRTKRQVAEEWMAREGLRLPAAARPPRITRAILQPVREAVRARPR